MPLTNTKKFLEKELQWRKNSMKPMDKRYKIPRTMKGECKHIEQLISDVDLAMSAGIETKASDISQSIVDSECKHPLGARMHQHGMSGYTCFECGKIVSLD